MRTRVKAKEITEPGQLLDALQAEMVARLSTADRTLRFDDVPDGPNVWLFVGVNGVGKTTTIGKVGAQQAALGRSVMMAAGDTFRAAAVEQLGTWAERSGAELVRGNEGGDPSAVIFDAIESATARHIDLVLGDTAGRLHTKTNLMEELRKVRRVAAKGAGQVTEVLLVVDATTGQNGLAQAREFGDATEVTGCGADQARRLRKGWDRVCDRNRARPAREARRARRVDRRPRCVRSQPSSSMPWSEKIHDSGNQRRFVPDVKDT